MPKLQQKSAALILRERRIFSLNFKLARIKAGLTQNALAKKTGLGQSFISDVENAKSTISLDHANLLASAVKLPLWQLLTPLDK
ncbi:MAG: helix-turn-helix transcriptional regulator [Nitrosospira sp.]